MAFVPRVGGCIAHRLHAMAGDGASLLFLSYVGRESLEGLGMKDEEECGGEVESLWLLYIFVA